MEGEVACEYEVAALGAHCGGLEGGRRVVLDVEEVSGLDVAVTLLVLGVDGGNRNFGLDRGVPSSATVILPENSSNVPRTLDTTRWRTEKPTVEWTVSMTQVPAVNAGSVVVAAVIETP